MSLNPIQFPFQQPMFLPASQILSEARLGDQGPGESSEGVIERKLREAKSPLGTTRPNGDPLHGAGVHEAVREGGGVHTPVALSIVRENSGDPTAGVTTKVTDGHHRIVTAADLGQEVPVNWYDGRAAPRNMTLGSAHTFYDTKTMQPGYDQALEAVRQPR